MSKKLDWDAISTPHGTRPLPGAVNQPKYTSGKERMLKAFAEEEAQAERMKFLAKAEPGMQAVFNYRMVNRQPLKVVRPLRFTTSVMNKSVDPNTGEMRGGSFVNQLAVVEPGTVLTPVAVDPTMQEYIFKSQHGEEVAIGFSEIKNILMSTDIFDLVSKHLRGE